MPQPGGCITARCGTGRCAIPRCGARTATMGGRRACLPGGRPGSAAASARDSDNRQERVGDRVVARGCHVPRGWEVVVLGVSAEGCVAGSAGRRGGSSVQPSGFLESAVTGTALLLGLAAPVFAALSWLAERRGRS